MAAKILESARLGEATAENLRQVARKALGETADDVALRGSRASVIRYSILPEAPHFDQPGHAFVVDEGRADPWRGRDSPQKSSSRSVRAVIGCGNPAGANAGT